MSTKKTPELFRDSKPRYLIRVEVRTTTLADGALGCDVCGFPIEGPHYSTGPHGTNHCTVCHPIGQDWRQPKDSERPGTHLPDATLEAIDALPPTCRKRTFL